MIRSLVLSVALVFGAAGTTVLSGCAQLGLASVQSFEDKLYATTATVSQIERTTSVLLNARKISSNDAKNVLKATDAAAEGVTLAKAYVGVDQATANAKLAAAITALNALQTYLATQGAKP